MQHDVLEFALDLNRVLLAVHDQGGAIGAVGVYGHDLIDVDGHLDDTVAAVVLALEEGEGGHATASSAFVSGPSMRASMVSWRPSQLRARAIAVGRWLIVNEPQTVFVSISVSSG